MTDLREEVRELVRRLKGEKRGNHFSPFIDFIQFPRYRSFQKDLKVTFTFPLTVIVGANGTGKSSLLHALYGAPSGLTPGEWWFSTAVDPSDDEQVMSGEGRRKSLNDREKAAFWYQYQEDGEIKQPLKSRIRRQGDPDYWEPSRPVQKYGMKARTDNKRDPVVSMRSVYMNFKTQISAFDRCFYFSSPDAVARVERSAYWQKIKKTAKSRSVKIQDYLRWRSHRLKRVLVEGKTLKRGQILFHKPRISLTADELKDISFIVGRNYSAGYMVEHRFYETWGTSVMFLTDQLSYSDAFAGSGESAVVRLVHQLTSAKQGHLILLDEPETSLHPGAQERLLVYILRKTAEKKLQVVISTHSPSFVRLLPREAIRVMSIDELGKTQVSEEVNPDEAFHVIGHPTQNTVNLIVEDQLSKFLIDAVLNTQDESFRSQFGIDYRPGGESGMKADSTIFLRDSTIHRHLLFDGDKADSVSFFDLSTITIADTTETIDDAIKQHYGMRIQFRQDSNMSEQSKRELRINYINFANNCFHALPFVTPEQAIWNDERAKAQLNIVGCSDSEFEEIDAASDYKVKFKILTRLTQPEGTSFGSGEISTIHRFFIKAFCNEESQIKTDIINLLKEIADNAGVH